MASKYLWVADNGELAGEEYFFGVIMALDVTAVLVEVLSVIVSAKFGWLPFLPQIKYETTASKTATAPM